VALAGTRAAGLRRDDLFSAELLGPGILVVRLPAPPADPVVYLGLFVGTLAVGLLITGTVGWLELRKARRPRAGNDTPVSRP